MFKLKWILLVNLVLSREIVPSLTGHSLNRLNRNTAVHTAKSENMGCIVPSFGHNRSTSSVVSSVR